MLHVNKLLKSARKRARLLLLRCCLLGARRVLLLLHLRLRRATAIRTLHVRPTTASVERKLRTT